MIAALACEAHIAPSQLLAEEPAMIDAMIEYLRWRAERLSRSRR